MFIRYRRDEKGRPVEQARIYTEKEHGISRSMIDPDATRIIERLKSAGHQAFIVGGAVRDLLQHTLPKDFDLVSDALPSKIKKLFRNARIIGKRFRLIHIAAGEKIFEVSTFRSNKNGSVGNEFGSIDEDALRRDFTFNALYFDPTTGKLVDFVGGFRDLKAGKIRPIIPLRRIFKEDPVRIVRGVKYGAMAGFDMSFGLKRAIRKDAHLLAEVSSSRMTEEFFKILASGQSESIFRALSEFRLLEYFVPNVWATMREDIGYSKRLFADLRKLDSLRVDVSDVDIERPSKNATARGKPKLSAMLRYFLQSWLAPEGSLRVDCGESVRAALLSARSFIQPLNPPRFELEAAVLEILQALGAAQQSKPRKTRRRRSQAGKGDRLPPGEGVSKEANIKEGNESPHT